MARILTLDLATSTGWARYSDHSGVKYGTKELPKTGERIGPFLTAFDDWLKDLLREDWPDQVVFEQPIVPRNGQLTTLRKLYGLCSHTELLCHRMKIPVSEAKVNTVRKHFIGCSPRREAAKDMTVRYCRTLGWDPQTDDEADALALLHYVAALASIDIGVGDGQLGLRPVA